MHGGEFFAPDALHVIKGETRHPLARTARDDLHRLGGVGVYHAFAADIQIFAVFAKDHDVDIFKARLDTRIITRRPHVDEELEFLAQRNRYTRINLLANLHRIGVAKRRLRRPFDRNLVAGDGFKYRGRQRMTTFVTGTHTGLDHFPAQINTGRRDDVTR